MQGKYSLVPISGVRRLARSRDAGMVRRRIWPRVCRSMRELISPRFDITPEMVTHTRVIDIKTGRPMSPVSPGDDGEFLPATKKTADGIRRIHRRTHRAS